MFDNVASYGSANARLTVPSQQKMHLGNSHVYCQQKFDAHAFGVNLAASFVGSGLRMDKLLSFNVKPDGTKSNNKTPQYLIQEEMGAFANLKRIGFETERGFTAWLHNGDKLEDPKMYVLNYPFLCCAGCADCCGAPHPTADVMRAQESRRDDDLLKIGEVVHDPKCCIVDLFLGCPRRFRMHVLKDDGGSTTFAYRGTNCQCGQCCPMCCPTRFDIMELQDRDDDPWNENGKLVAKYSIKKTLGECCLNQWQPRIDWGGGEGWEGELPDRELTQDERVVITTSAVFTWFIRHTRETHVPSNNGSRYGYPPPEGQWDRGMDDL